MWDLSRPEILVFWLTSLAGGALWVVALRMTDPVIRSGCDRSALARWGLFDVLAIGFFWLTAQSIGIAVAMELTDQPAGQQITDPQAAAWLAIGSGLGQLIAIGLALFYLCKRFDYRLHDFGLGSGQNGYGILAGIIGFAMWIPLVWAIQRLLVLVVEYSHPAIEELQSHPAPLVVVQTWFIAIVVAPVTEEFLFRAVLQGWFQRIGNSSGSSSRESLLWGDLQFQHAGKTPESTRSIHWPAIFAASFVFSLAHYNQGPAPVALFVLSIGLGYLYQRTGSLLACIVMHLLLNLITMTLISLELP